MQWNKIILAVALIGLTGCATTTPALDAHSAEFGKAISQNIAAQRVAPRPEDKANTFIPPNQARQKAARKAYEEGTVTAPRSVATTGNQ